MFEGVTNLGDVTIYQNEGNTTTVWSDGARLVAIHDEQEGQVKTAAEIGCSVLEMNRSHDLLHTLICRLIGLPWSPALRAAALGEDRMDIHYVEESAVLAVQKLAAMYGKL